MHRAAGCRIQKLMLECERIGVFDSGIGGLNVLKQCMLVLPHERFIYLSDSANMPYGKKSNREIRTAAMRCADMLFGMRCKAIVIACNTATAIAAEHIRALHPSRIVIGLEPAVKPCAKELGATGYAVALVTKATAASVRFSGLIERYGDGRIVPVIAAELAKLIEDGADATDYLYELLAPYRDAESVVLGCSHFSYVTPVIEKFYGGNVKIYDGAVGAAAHLKYCLGLAGLINEEGIGGVEYIKTMRNS